MICDKCNNLLKIEKVNNTVQYVCINCGNSYALTNNYTLIYESSNVETVLDKKGTDIYYLPCNPREYKGCPGCGEEIVAYERITKVYTKIYGFKCGKMWYEKTEFDEKTGSVVAKPVQGGGGNVDEKSNNKISITELLKHSR
jgi:DNA-directed RNA polymerase subunit M/transcription elongation factor TFIIS